MVKSARDTAKNPLDIVAYIDRDDEVSEFKAKELGISYLMGPKVVFTDYWNQCASIAQGDIYMQCGDDVVFRTPNWDVLVEKVFSQFPDRIVLVHGDDLQPRFGRFFGTHPFVHKRWVEATGYFVPPYFKWGSGDQWLNEVANYLKRRCFVPIVTEHMHFSEGKAETDSTYQTDTNIILEAAELYQRMGWERMQDVEKLTAAMQKPVIKSLGIKKSNLIKGQQLNDAAI